MDQPAGSSDLPELHSARSRTSCENQLFTANEDSLSCGSHLIALQPGETQSGRDRKCNNTESHMKQSGQEYI